MINSKLRTYHIFVSLKTVKLLAFGILLSVFISKPIVEQLVFSDEMHTALFDLENEKDTSENEDNFDKDEELKFISSFDHSFNVNNSFLGLLHYNSTTYNKGFKTILLPPPEVIIL